MSRAAQRVRRPLPSSGRLTGGIWHRGPTGDPRESVTASKLRALLSSRRALQLSLLLATVLSLPTMRMGFLLDDLKLLAHAEEFVAAGRPLDYFSFARDPSELRGLVERGPFPWWTLPNLKLAFFRPLSSATIWFDSKVFHRQAWAFHLHSIAWFLGLVVAVAAFYRRTLPPAVAPLALILFTLDDVHWIPVGWLANRNALIAAVPAVLGLVAHLRWREDGWRPGRIWAPVGVAVGLAGGESALAFLGYFVAWELCSDRPVKERLRALGPTFAVVAAWAVLYRWLGFGAFGSDTYVDPGADPLRFLTVAGPRLLALLGSLTLKLSSDLWLLVPPARLGLYAGGLLGVGLVTLVARYVWPQLEPRERKALKWLATGAGLSLGPGLATFPADRLLLPASLGSLGVLAVLFRAVWKLKTVRARAAVLWLTLTTVVVPIPAWILGPMVLGSFGRAGEAAVLDCPPERLQKRVVLLNAVDPGVGLYAPLFLRNAGRPVPQRWWPLSADPNPHRLRRVGERALELEVLGGRMLDQWFERLVRDERFPLEPGHRVQLDGAAVTVLAADGGKPTRIRVDLELAMSEHRLLILKNGALVELEAPPLGESVELEAQPSPLEVSLDWSPRARQ